jgi:ankyrin repeat protein
LNAASAEGQVAIVSKLIEAGADVKVSDEHYGNALQSAAHQGKGDVLRILAEAGVE